MTQKLSLMLAAIVLFGLALGLVMQSRDAHSTQQTQAGIDTSKLVARGSLVVLAAGNSSLTIILNGLNL
jgi:hypothetical protein